MRQLMWFRTDLRVQDNTALHAALTTGPTIALYLISPGQWRAHDDAPAKVDFWLRNLAELAWALGRLNVPLLIRQADTWADAPGVVRDLCHELDIGSVQVNEEYGVNETRRDRTVAERLAAHGIVLRSHIDQLFFRPGSVLSQSGSYFQVYSQFRKICYQRLHTALPSCLPPPRAQEALGIPSDTLPAAVDGFPVPSESLRRLWPAGEEAALERLEAFALEELWCYEKRRDFPAQPGTSQLSPYLAAGVLAPPVPARGASQQPGRVRQRQPGRCLLDQRIALA